MSEEVDALKRTISERDAMIAQLKVSVHLLVIYCAVIINNFDVYCCRTKRRSL